MEPKQLKELWEDLDACVTGADEVLGIIDEVRKGKYGDYKKIEGLEELLNDLEGIAKHVYKRQNDMADKILEIEDMADEERSIHENT